MDPASQVLACRSYLRRRYPTLDSLRALEDSVFASATQEVLLTSNSYEGGSASGQAKFDKMILLTAIQSLMNEMDPDAVPDERISCTHFPSHD